MFGCGLAHGQIVSGKTSSETSSSNLIAATNEYKASSKELLAIEESQVSKAEAKLQELRTLVTEGLVARVTLEAEEQRVAALCRQLQETQKQIADSETRVAQIKADEELRKKQATVKLTAKQYGTLNSAAMMLRYSGPTAWSIGGLSSIQTFFSVKFGHSLPMSAIGQSATHDRLGYDHRNAVDVALHPDSTEGKALISFLQTQGIPFLAFRGAIPGVATGPHIHIGSPSHRLS
jgi:hypothetical protein